MSIVYKQLSFPEELAVSVVEAALHLRLVTELSEVAALPDAEKNYVTGLIETATRYCEGYCRRQLVVTEWAGYMDCFPGRGSLVIQKSPVVEVTEIRYFDENGTERTLEAGKYDVDVISEPARIGFKEMPNTANRLNAVCIKFKAGYAKQDGTFDAALVPKAIKQAILLIVGHLYEHREEVLVGVSQTQIDFGVDRLLDTERVFMF